MGRRRGVLAGITAVVLAAATVFVGVAPAAFAVAAFSIQKTTVEQGPFSPGDTVTFQIVVNCSSTNDPGCFDTVLSDTLPAPLEFNPDNPTPVTVALAAPSGQPVGEYDLAVDPATNSFTVTPGTDLDASPVVWPAGNSMTITVNAIVPPDAEGTWDGQTVTNTASVAADNASTASSSADVTLAVETTLVPSIDKSVTPTTTIPAVPGRPVDWTVTPGNASNQNVDTIVVQDPVSPPSTFSGYLDVTGYDVTAPAGTTSTTTEYYVDGVWTTTEPDPISDAGGIRVTFTGTFAPGATGSVVVHTVTNDGVTTIFDGEDVTVTNDASSTVSKGADTSDPVTDDAGVTIAQREPDVSITKSFGDNTLVSGQSTTADITATVGEQNVQTVTITEPSAGSATFTDQGLRFDGFGDGISWPVAATSAEITYTYSDCATSTASTTTVNTLPAPTADCTVEGYTVVFSAEGDDIVSGAYATLPMDVTALTTESAVASTNVVDTAVENTNGQTGTAEAEAPFTIEPLFLDTSVTKGINPDRIWGVPGTTADMTLTGNVTPESTAGSDKLVISDPAFPGTETEFWDSFTVTQIDDTDIPECTTLTVRYWSTSAGEWVDFPGATEVPGPESLWSYDVPAELQSDIGGIQFEYLPMDAEGCPAQLAPGFTVVTHLDLELTQEVDETTTFTNTAQSLVDNPDAGGEHTDTAADGIDVEPIEGGDGPDFLDKEWTPEDNVAALTGDVRTARLWWSTDGLNISQMTLTDISETQNPATTVSTVYDAFDLVRIDPITTATDPLIANAVISEVSLYLDGSGWTDITSQACAAGCDGGFGGYTLTDAQSEDTLSVRIVLTEKTPGAGVGSSYDRRPIDLDFRVRDTLRSNPDQWVLGDLHPYTYNTTSPGRVNNTASAHGVNPATGVDSVDVADDDIQIVDQPINATMTKTFDQDQLGLPDPSLGIDPADYPLISGTITATNTSAARVVGMTISDPTSGQALADTAFDTLNLYDIDAIQVPQGITEAETSVTLAFFDGTSTTYSYADALALGAADLVDVVGVTVTFRDDDGGAVIATGATGGITLTWQLREELRSAPGTLVTVTPPGESIENDAHTQLESPVLDDCADNQCGTGAADANDDFQIVAASYTITTTKSITPASIYEDQSKSYVTNLGGRPNGTARTTFFSLTDTTPTFWNTMDYVGAQINVPAPVNNVAMDVLVDDDAGSDVEYTESGGVLTATCNGQPLADDSPCWVNGEWVDAAPGTIESFDLPAGVADAGTVVGVRFRAQEVDADGNVLQWERPYNPQLTFSLTTMRRDTLRSDPSTLVSTTRPDLQPNPGETALGVISNDVQSYSEAQFGAQTFTQTGEAAASTIVRHRTNAVSVTKTRGSSQLIAQSANIPYVITATNTGQWNMTGFTIVDQVATDANGSLLVEPDPPAYRFALSGTGAPTGDPGFTASLDEATGLLTITPPDGFVFNAGWTLTVNAPLKFRADVTPDTIVTNEVTVSSDRLFETCQGTTVANGRDLTPKPVENTPPGVPDCSADTSVAPLAAATIAAKKYVKGDDAGDPTVPGDDDLGVLAFTGGASSCDPSVPGVVTATGFYSYPCAPVTRPGGNALWQVDFTNTGNTAARVVAAVDTLPTVGDQGVIVPGDRGSQFPVSLTGQLQANFDELVGSATATYGIYLSPVQLSQSCNSNAIKVWTENATPDPNCSFGWVRADASTPSAVIQAARSMMLVLEYENPTGASPAPGLEPGETLRLIYQTQTPYVLPANSAVPDGLPVAWNSFATASRSNATVTQPERASLVVEPQKVGIAAATGQLEMQKTVVAPEFASPIDLPDEYPLLVSCVSGGQQTTLLHADGSDASRPLLPADGTVLVYDSATGPVNLPLFADCSVVEDPVTPGVEWSVDPDSTVTAERDFVQDTRVWDPYTGDTDSTLFQITNEYSAGGFTVEKAVDDGGAVNQDGEPITYDRTYTFTASCIFLDQEAIPEADRTFTLERGQSKTFENLPAGAQCTVTETDAGGAASTTITVTEDGDGTVDQPFAILPYEEGTTTARTDVAVENVYTTGSVRVVKTVTGAGAEAWGAGPFTVEMTCTLDGVSPNPVFEDTRTLTSPDDLTWQVDDLPTGAECTVTETDDGGANESTAGVTVTVGDDTTGVVDADITNVFTLGSLEVHKELEGAPANGLDPATTDTYTVSLACTRVVNGETVDVAIPGGATRTITGAGTAVYEGLPTGAECTVTETDQGFATGTPVITPDQPVTIGSGTTPVEVTVTNVFENGSVSVQKSVAAPAGFPVPESFTATVSCTWQGADVPLADDGVVTIVPGEDPVVIPDVPVGSICSVEEDDAGQTGTTVSPESITVAEADQTFAFDVENTYEWASLEVGKLVESLAPEIPTGFEFSVVCMFQGETVVDETFTLDANETETITEIPARSECTVTETDDRAADATITAADVPGVEGDLAPIIDQATRTVVIPELQPDSTAVVNTVTYTNYYDATAVILVKEFEGAGAAQFGLDKTFTFSVTCTFGGETLIDTTIELNAENGWSSAVHDVVAGSECTVVEDDLNGADAVVITPNDGEDTSVGTGIVPVTGGLVTVTATNWYLTGSAEVTKTFAGDGAEKFGTSAYELSLTCVRDGELVDIPDGRIRVVSADSPTALWTNLPTGSECRLVEQDAGGANSTEILDAEGNVLAGDGEGYTFTVETDPTILSVDDQPQPSLQVRNTFNLAQVSVTKTVDNSGAVDANGDPVVYGPFEVTLACMWDEQQVTAAEPMTQQIADGETVTWTELPEGADCTVTETDTAGAESTTSVVTEGGATGDPQTGTVVELAPLPNTDAADQTSAVITNVFGVTDLSISKIVDGTGASSVTRTFPVDVTCVLIDPSHPDPGLVVLDASYDIGGPNRLTAEVSNLPAGSECTVTETDTGSAAQTTMTVDGEEQPGASGTVTLTSGQVTIVFTNTFIAPLPATGLESRATVLALAAGFAILAGGVALVIVAMRRRRLG
ncbi:hypothetical protein JNB62_02465 [Microbacterium jejuense]|uniref:Plant heme peroxidase family profile domain-containing protein n=1 Tax=Microbacterium jejuense TaxID=1263637 RepID=A0ABS7HL01_9MICO|nr:DUF5979 domain-containing protein [Microbacterium jejuense]MBW9092543.1 hypothetical protein [Microbacterium jejuense]